jgi:methylisocitrate lyase
MVLKLKAALDARHDPDFIIIARTDARAVEGVEAALKRGNLYGATGADIIFIDAPQSREELERIPREVKYPLLVVMLTGGVTPMLSLDELSQLGYKIVLWPIETLLASGAAIQQLIRAVRTRGRPDQDQTAMMSFAEIKKLVRMEEVLQMRERLEGREGIDDRKGGRVR